MATIGETLVCPKCGQERLEHEFRLTDPVGGKRGECAFCGYFYESLYVDDLHHMLTKFDGLQLSVEELRGSLSRMSFNFIGILAFRAGFFHRGLTPPDPSSPEGWGVVNTWFQVPTPLAEEAQPSYLTLNEDELSTFRASDWFGYRAEDKEILDVIEAESSRGPHRPSRSAGDAFIHAAADISCVRANEAFGSRSVLPFGQLLLLMVHLLRPEIDHDSGCCSRRPGSKDLVLLELGWVPSSEA